MSTPPQLLTHILIISYDRMRSNPEAMPFLSQALEIATFEPGMYEVVETFTGA